MRQNDILTIYKYPATVFSMKDITLIWKETDLNNIKARVNYYVRTGKLYSPRKGFYSKDRNYNPMELAIKIYTPSYISFESVLLKEGLIFQYSGAVTAASYLSREITTDTTSIIYRKLKDRVLYNDTGIERKDNISIATKERAFLDMVYLVMDYYFDNLRPLDWNKCKELVAIYEDRSLITALRGYHARYKKT